jgi:hypothetical protein
VVATFIPDVTVPFTLPVFTPKVKAVGVVFVNVLTPATVTAFDAEPIETVEKLVDAVEIFTFVELVAPVLMLIVPLLAPNVPILRTPVVCVVAIF